MLQTFTNIMAILTFGFFIVACAMVIKNQMGDEE